MNALYIALQSSRYDIKSVFLIIYKMTGRRKVHHVCSVIPESRFQLIHVWETNKFG